MRNDKRPSAKLATNVQEPHNLTFGKPTPQGYGNQLPTFLNLFSNEAFILGGENIKRPADDQLGYVSRSRSIILDFSEWRDGEAQEAVCESTEWD